MKGKSIKNTSILSVLFTSFFLSACGDKGAYEHINYEYKTKYLDPEYQDNDNSYYYDYDINQDNPPSKNKPKQPAPPQYPYGDNDADYYPIFPDGNKDSTKGVYEPFATDNLVPYEDNDEVYYPYVYDY